MIHYYKEASSFNSQYAKNNLGIIYKNGIGDEIKKNLGFAVVYFKEAIDKFDDKVSMYNLSHIYIYEFNDDEKINEAIELLIRSYKLNFEPAKDLLCIALIMKHGCNHESISNQCDKIDNDLKSTIIQTIKCFESKKESLFKYYSSIDYLYNCNKKIIPSYILNDPKENKLLNDAKNIITQDFYDGFGL